MRRRPELKDYQNELRHFKLRLAVLGLIVIIGFSILIMRFYFLQVARYDHYHALAENNRISIIPVAPTRGIITDRNGTTIAHNFFAYALEITPSKVDDLDEKIAEISKLVSISSSDIKRFNKLKQRTHEFESIPIRTHLNEVEAAKFAANRFRFPGVEIKSRLLHRPHQ